MYGLMCIKEKLEHLFRAFYDLEIELFYDILIESIVLC